MSDPILELLAAPPNPSMSVDEDAVHAGGRRRVRRRAARRGAVGLVGVVGAAAIAFAALGGGVANDALPAGPSPSANTAGRVSTEILDGRYAVEVLPGAPSGQPNVIFYAIKDGRRQQLAGSDASPDVVSMGTGSGADGVMLGTAPATATDFLTITRDEPQGSPGGSEMDRQPLRGTDFQAVAIDFETASGPDRYLDTVWLDTQGVVRHANGTLIPSVLVPGTQDRLFVDQESGPLIGAFFPSGGVHQNAPDSGLTVLGYGERADAGSWTWRSSVLLPAGASAATFRWSSATQGGDVAVLALPGMAGTIATAPATAPAGGEGPSLVEVTWTDAAGTRHIDPVG